MIDLFKYELFKLYKDPLYKFFLILTLFIGIIPIIYFKYHNRTITTINFSYVNSLDFPYQVLQEILPFMYNISIIFFSTYIMHEVINIHSCIIPISKGFSIFKLILIKIFILFIYFTLDFLILYLSNSLFGLIFFKNTHYIIPFFTNVKLHFISAYIYSLKFYIYGLFTIFPFVCLMIVINILTKNTNLSIAIGFIYTFVGLILPSILLNYNNKYINYCMISIPFIQNKLLPFALVNSSGNILFFKILLLFFIICILLIYFLSKTLEL